MKSQTHIHKPEKTTSFLQKLKALLDVFVLPPTVSVAGTPKQVATFARRLNKHKRPPLLQIYLIPEIATCQSGSIETNHCQEEAECLVRLTPQMYQPQSREGDDKTPFSFVQERLTVQEFDLTDAHYVPCKHLNSK